MIDVDVKTMYEQAQSISDIPLKDIPVNKLRGLINRVSGLDQEVPVLEVAAFNSAI